jgi:hypothetical protein
MDDKSEPIHVGLAASPWSIGEQAQESSCRIFEKVLDGSHLVQWST